MAMEKILYWSPKRKKFGKKYSLSPAFKLLIDLGTSYVHGLPNGNEHLNQALIPGIQTALFLSRQQHCLA